MFVHIESRSKRGSALGTCDQVVDGGEEAGGGVDLADEGLDPGTEGLMMEFRARTEGDDDEAGAAGLEILDEMRGAGSGHAPIEQEDQCA